MTSWLIAPTPVSAKVAEIRPEYVFGHAGEALDDANELFAATGDTATLKNQVYYPIKVLSGRRRREHEKAVTITASRTPGGSADVVIKALQQKEFIDDNGVRRSEDTAEFMLRVAREVNINRLMSLGSFNGMCQDDVTCASSLFAVLDNARVFRRMPVMSYIVYPYQNATALVEVIASKRNVLDVIYAQDPDFYAERLSSLAHQMVKAVASLHTIGISHADVKPDNMLVSKDLKNLWLIDFDLSCMIDDDLFGELVDKDAHFSSTVSCALDPSQPDSAVYPSTGLWADPASRDANGDLRSFPVEQAGTLWKYFDIGSLARCIYVMYGYGEVDIPIGQNIPFDIGERPSRMPERVYSIVKSMSNPDITARSEASTYADRLLFVHNLISMGGASVLETPSPAPAPAPQAGDDDDVDDDSKQSKKKKKKEKKN